MAEDREAPEVGKLPRAWTEVVQRQKIAIEQETQRVHSWTVQNEMRGVLGQVSTSAAKRILGSTNSREIRA